MDQRFLQNARLAIGLLQGVLLYGLHWTFAVKIWPATDGYLFAPLLAVTFFVPLIAISGLGNLRPRRLLVWLLVTASICALLAFYDIYRSPVLFINGARPRIVPSFPATFWLAATLFIGHSLVVATDSDSRFIARYPTLFDVSWKHGVQVMLAAIFSGVLWAILFLGASLFALIHITLIGRIIREPIFWIPVVAVSFAYALHIADVRADIVRGARTLLLVLLSWLLPVMTVLAVGFVLTLPFTGLDVLWGTRRAASILLYSAATLVFLINAAYQDGEDSSAAFLRYCRVIAAVILVPIVALAGYALMLRVSQYGWTPERVAAAALILIASCYALGYAYAAASSGLTLRLLEPVNVLAAFVIVGVLLALLTPLADPMRISVTSQVRRLENGGVAPGKFDYTFLRANMGRYGRDALEALSTRTEGANALVIAGLARHALDSKTLPATGRAMPPPPSVEKRLANITVLYPKGAHFPAAFLAQDWTADPHRYSLPRCITGDAKCEAVFVDLNGDGQDEILLFLAPGGSGVAFDQDDGAWRYVGALTNSFCRGFRESLRQGDVAVVAPRFSEIQSGGQRVSINSGCVLKPSVPAKK